MSEIIEYDIKITSTYTDLIAEVNEAIYNEWVPIGGVSVSLKHESDISAEANYTKTFCQALVKYRKSINQNTTHDE